MHTKPELANTKSKQSEREIDKDLRLLVAQQYVQNSLHAITTEEKTPSPITYTEIQSSSAREWLFLSITLPLVGKRKIFFILSSTNLYKIYIYVYLYIIDMYMSIKRNKKENNINCVRFPIHVLCIGFGEYAGVNVQRFDIDK